MMHISSQSKGWIGKISPAGIAKLAVVGEANVF